MVKKEDKIRVDKSGSWAVTQADATIGLNGEGGKGVNGALRRT